MGRLSLVTCFATILIFPACQGPAEAAAPTRQAAAACPTPVAGGTRVPAAPPAAVSPAEGLPAASAEAAPSRAERRPRGSRLAVAPVASAQSCDTVPPAEPAVGDEARWRERLTPEQYRILREGGTERAFSGGLWDEHRNGVYRCAACGAVLFDSDDKFDSGTGWPSFTGPVEHGRVATRTDTSHGMARTEVRCPHCGSHLGHVFEDGPAPTGLRYCINSASLEFRQSGGEQ